MLFRSDQGSRGSDIARAVRPLLPDGRAQIRFDGALQLDRHRIAAPIDRLAGDDAHPTFADAILFNVVAVDAVETDADAALQEFLIEERALRIVAQPVGEGVAHGGT